MTRDRTNTHRRCFSEDKWEDSALSMHARTKHEELFDLQNFRKTLVKKCSPKQSAGKSLRLLISIGQKSEESIDTKTSMFSLGTADDN